MRIAYAVSKNESSMAESAAAIPAAPSLPGTMRAWIARGYGGPEMLALCDLPIPRPGPRDLLIRVQASTVSSGDRRLRAMDFPRGLGLIGRAVFGLRRLRRPILGAELTGIVAAVGDRVRGFVPGDAVIAMTGMRGGGHGEYALVRADTAIVHRPEAMPLEVAASLAFGGTSARDFLRRAGVTAGERVLVIGASGTVGSALVQLAKASGASVTASTSTANLELVRGLGADAVIDYFQQDITRMGSTFDIVADAVGGIDFARALPLLAEGGRYLAINAGVPDMLARSRQGRRCISGPAKEAAADLAALAALWTEGRFRPLIDSVLPFNDLPCAHARADTGRKRGSVVVTMP